MRNFYEGDSEIDILMRFIDHLKDDVEEIKFNQEELTDKLERVCAFIDKVDASKGLG